MSKRLLNPPNLVDQWRLLRWLFLQPDQFTRYTRDTVKNLFDADTRALLLPEDATPEQLVIVRKLAVGVTRYMTFDKDFAAAIQRAFEVPDDQIPERILLQFRVESWHRVARELALLSPAAYAVIRHRRALDRQVQRASGWLGTTLALLPLLPTVLADTLHSHAPPEILTLLLVSFAAVWASFGLVYAKPEYASETLAENVRSMAGCGLYALVLVFLLAGVYHAALESAAGLIPLSAALGITYGICLILPVRHPLSLIRAGWMAVGGGTAAAFYASGGQRFELLALVVLAVSMMLLTAWALKRGLGSGRAPRINRLLLAVLGAAGAVQWVSIVSG